ncbi:MAG: hypothetical protein NBV65_02185 [Burkholderiaceae bacterium]|nr:hypothetical protein [Burkholderiaceae bacterium]
MSTPLSRNGANPSLPAIRSSESPTADPLDFMFVSSRKDFDPVMRKLLENCKLAGVRATVIYLESLPGKTEDEKLAQLQQLNATWQAQGLITDSTLKVVALHGDDFSRPGGAKVHLESHFLSASGDSLRFPTKAFDAAMRNITSNDGQRSVGFSGTLIYQSCNVGSMRQALQASGGAYVLLAGKQPSMVRDSMACLADLTQEAGKRKREQTSPLSGRECWMRVSQVSGEHVAYVKGDIIDVTKVTQSGNAAFPPAAKSLGAQKIYYALVAKLLHGTAETVERLFDVWGPEVIRQAVQSTEVTPYHLLLTTGLTHRAMADKLLILNRHGLGLPETTERMLACIETVISHSREALLALVFGACASEARSLTPATFLDWLATTPEIQKSLATLCTTHPELQKALSEFLRGRPDTQQPALPLAGLIPALRRIVMAPALADLPPWLADELIDYALLPTRRPGESIDQVAVHAWRALLAQKAYSNAREFLSLACMQRSSEINSAVRTALPEVFVEAVNSRNVKLTRALISLDHERRLAVGLFPALAFPGGEALRVLMSEQSAEGESLRMFFKAVLPNG